MESRRAVRNDGWPTSSRVARDGESIWGEKSRRYCSIMGGGGAAFGGAQIVKGGPDGGHHTRGGVRGLVAEVEQQFAIEAADAGGGVGSKAKAVRRGNQSRHQ